MNRKVKAIVDGFKNLTDENQTRAYMEIEAIWKAPRDQQPAARSRARPRVIAASKRPRSSPS